MQTQQLSLINNAMTNQAATGGMRAAFDIPFGPTWPDQLGQAMRAWAKRAVSPPIRTLSLFTGAGGLDIGFHDAGFEVLAMVEINKTFTETLQANCGPRAYFESSAVVCQDIRTYIPPQDSGVDFIIGGPPCQTFSAAGRRAAGVAGVSDARGTLFEEYARIIELLSPRGFLFENVYGLTGAQNGSAWEKIRAGFADCGYSIFHRVLDTADYGAPQHRERVFIVGTRGEDYLFPAPTHGPDSLDNNPYFTAKDAVAGVAVTKDERDACVGGRYGYLLNDIPPGLNYSFYTETMGHPMPLFAWRSKFSDFLYKADPDAPVRTIKAQGGQYTGPFHWESRRFSVGELKRLQTIPDSYQLKGAAQAAVQQIGNSVPPQAARMLALSILKQLFGVELPFTQQLLTENQALGFRKRKRGRTALYKEKARIALREGGQAKPSVARKRRYLAVLSDGFGWDESLKAPNGMTIDFSPGKKEWRVTVAGGDEQADTGFEVEVVASPRNGWAVPAEKVVLIGGELSKKVFTSVWKAFETELARAKIKADLVQLCGYYQYAPAFHCSMTLCDPGRADKRWRVVEVVVSGTGTKRILAIDELAELWQVGREDVPRQALFLRALGYEVRNSNTNPTIPDDCFLVPYAFPTLTPQSVQLRKSLGE